jgi:hypothetical protein
MTFFLIGQSIAKSIFYCAAAESHERINMGDIFLDRYPQ